MVKTIKENIKKEKVMSKMDVVSKPGEYTNFTGRIKYGITNCEVTNASFEIFSEPLTYHKLYGVDILFYCGDIVSGNIVLTKIKNCNFQGDCMYLCILENGIFEKGRLVDSTWLGGEWKSGEWGLYNYDDLRQFRLMPPPFDKFDEAKDVITNPGRYKNFTGRVKFNDSDFEIENGDLEVVSAGRFNIAINKGVINSGNLTKAIVNHVVFNGNKVVDCFWKDGIFNGEFFGGHHACWANGIWENGVFSESTWWNGIWNAGTWIGGAWRNGVWNGGQDEDGLFYDKNNNPNKW